MRVLAFRHVPFEGLGLIEPVLARARRFDRLRRCSTSAGAALPDAADYDALIFLGGPMSVNDDLPYLRREMELHPPGRGAAAARARHLPGRAVDRQRAGREGVPERREGNRLVRPAFHRRRRRAIRCFAGFPRETVFHWHGETFDLPPGAELLASSRSLPQSGIPHSIEHLRTPVPPGGDARDDRRLVRAGRELRGCARA